jgi:thymidylate synthase
MNQLDKQYTELLQDILDNGVEKKDRTGTGTLSVFGRQIRHKMSEGFPLLTTKKMAWKTMVVELLWFLRGETNIKFLLDYDCHIWDGDAYKNYVDTVDKMWLKSGIGDLDDMIYDRLLLVVGDGIRLLTQEEFIYTIKLDDEFAKKWGDLGPIYGAQWRGWRVGKGIETTLKTEDGETIYEAGSMYIDQIQNLINDLKTNPDSRRLMVNAWNVGELNQMVLPPCHYGFQVYTTELSDLRRYNIWFNNNYETGMERFFDPKNLPDFDNPYYTPTPKRAISLMWNQRSVDTFLGLPFNIASYALLLEIIAKEVDMIPDELIGNLGDVHLYSNHIEQSKEQIGRTLTFDERYSLYTGHDKTWEEDGGNSYGKINGLDMMDDRGIPTRTREPYPLPSVKITHREWYQHEKVKEHLGEKTFNEKILALRPDCFELLNYKSHPPIKAPLSN